MTQGERRRDRAKAALLAAALLPLSVLPALAQDPGGPGPVGRISGVIQDAEGGLPLAGATITLEPMPLGLVTSPEGGGGGFLESMLATESDSEGRYAFDGLVEATYRLRVARLGYRSATMLVEYRGPRESRVSVGLEIQPIQLAPVEVTLDPLIPMTSSPTNEEVPGAERIQVELTRQARYDQADVRSLTRQDVVEAVTLGETDIFRALQRLPGVTAEDEFSAELWTRGARWDETRVYFDGLPLLNPIHGGGVLTGVSPDGVGAVLFHPGVRPVGTGDGSAAVVEMGSRPAGGELPVSAMAQVSLVSGRFAVQSPYARGSGVTLAARRTWLDLATQSVSQSTADPTVMVPYRFSDVAGRWDQRISDHVSVEASALWAGDQIEGDLPDLLAGTRAEWGNTVARATLEGRWSAVRARLTVGGSRYEALLRQAEPDPDILVEFPGLPQAPPVDNLFSTGQVELTVDRYARDEARTAWRAGLRLGQTDLEYRGPAPVPFPAGADDGAFEYDADVSHGTLWYEYRLAPASGLEVRLGAQADLLENRDAGTDGGFFSPRLSAAYALGSDARVTVGLGRHYQFEQALAGVGFDLGPRLVPSHVWVQAGGPVPALRADIATLGGELWLGAGFLLSGSGYLRRSEGTLVPAPGPTYVRAGGLLDDAAIHPAWQSASGTAGGLDVSLRRIAGRVTGSVAYSLGKADLNAGGRTFPSPGDRRHAVDATLFLRLASWVRVGGAFTSATGAPFTRFFPLDCPEDERCPATSDPGAPPVVGYADEPNGRRGPHFATVDLLMELEGNVMGLRLGTFIQVKNVGAIHNPSSYLGSSVECLGPFVNGACAGASVIEDRFEQGIPVFPLLGFWARF